MSEVIKKAERVKDGFRNFRDRAFREKQVKAIEAFWGENKGKRFHVYQMFAGSGKTLLSMTLAGMMPGKVACLCSTKQLQDQMMKDFPEAGYIKGRGNYQCVANGGDCVECLHSSDSPCEMRSECEYQIAKEEMKRKKIHVMNYHYFLNLMNYDPKWVMDIGGGYDLVVCDEADVLEQILTEFIAVEIGKEYGKRIGVEVPYRVSSKAKDVENIWRDWAEKAGRIVWGFYKGEFAREMDKKGIVEGTKDWMRSEKKIKGVMQGLGFLKENVTKEWLFEDKDGRYSFKPLWMNERMFENVMGKFGKRFLFMSGSLPSKQAYCRLIGLGEDDCFYAKTGSNVPVENRLIYIDYKGSMGGKKQGETLPSVVKRIEELLDIYEGKKGIVHTVSFKLMEVIYEQLGKDYQHRIVLHKPGMDKDALIKGFKSGGRDKVLFSPSCTRGVDLPDDYCRFVVMPKAPFGYLGDKLISSRFYSGQWGQKWYSEMAAQDLIQGTARGLRHEGDWCDCWLLDEDFKRVFVRGLVPDWMMDGKRYGREFKGVRK